MRRLATALGVIVAVVAAVALAPGGPAAGSADYRFSVVFDNARGLIAGQLVKVAGAKAGTIEAVTLTPGFKAQVTALIDGRFRPFHADATCTIRPEGLIAENYIDCDPGIASAPLAVVGGTPTVPVRQTTEPVNLLDLFGIFNAPTRDRFALIVDELGIGLAGRGSDVNGILRRANPALAEAGRVTSILDHQRAELATLVDATNTVAAEAAGHTTAITAFLDRAASLAGRIEVHRDALRSAVARLPGTLAAATPALIRLDAVAQAGTPLLNELQAAAPNLNRVADTIVPFAALARPGLARLDGALAAAIPALRASRPLLRTLRTYTTSSQPSNTLFARLLGNLQRSSFAENLLQVFYYTMAGTARYDGSSHILPAYLFSPARGACANYATVPVAGCSAHPTGSPVAVRHDTGPGNDGRSPATARAGRAGRAATTAPPAPPPAPARGGARAPGPGSGPPVPPPPSEPGAALGNVLQTLTNYLLR